MEEQTLLTTEELAKRIHYNSRYIRQNLIDAVLIEGVHYFRPFGRRKILFVWETIKRDMFKSSGIGMLSIPLSRGGVCHG
jgi:hypothetical protein